MTESRKNSALPKDAFEWDARLRSPDCTEGDRASFEAWLEASPENRQAFDDLRSMLGESLHAVADDPSVRSMREVALDALGKRPPWYQRRGLLGLAAAAAITVLAVGITFFERPAQNISPPASTPTFATSIGERSTTELEDGSVAILNTQTRIAVDYTAKERLVTLVRGQALFDVAKDPDRPFVVVAGEQRITAIGTVFDVRYEGSDVEVTLVEGVVEVTPEPGLGTTLVAPTPKTEPVVMSAGQWLRTSAVVTDEAPELQSVDADQATLWRQGRVFFDDAPLSEAIAEMNRYSTVQIEVSDRTLDQHRVNGMFRTGRQTAFVDAVETYFPIDAEQTSDNRIVLNPQRGQ